MRRRKEEKRRRKSPRNRVKMPTTIFFTGKGDGGKSSLGKKKISKDEKFFELLGDLDFLNSWLGMCYVEGARITLPKSKVRLFLPVISVIRDVQEAVFIAQAEIGAIAAGMKVKDKRIRRGHISYLEEVISGIDDKMPAIKKFVVPGGSELSARLDVARTLARRAERTAVSFHKKNKLTPDFLRFINRLSSLLFALARYVNLVLNKKEAHPKYK